jgi:hypothetical protein
MKKITSFIIIGFIATIFFISHDALAQSIWDTNSVISPPVGGDVLPGQPIDDDTTIKDSAIFSKIIPFAIRYTMMLAIALSVGALIIGGYQYITAYGSSEKHDTATKTITYAIIGLILSITAYTIVVILTSIQLS